MPTKGFPLMCVDDILQCEKHLEVEKVNVRQVRHCCRLLVAHSSFIFSSSQLSWDLFKSNQMYAVFPSILFIAGTCERLKFLHRFQKCTAVTGFLQQSVAFNSLFYDFFTLFFEHAEKSRWEKRLIWCDDMQMRQFIKIMEQFFRKVVSGSRTRSYMSTLSLEVTSAWSLNVFPAYFELCAPQRISFSSSKKTLLCSSF